MASARPPGTAMKRTPRGQATVELALLLPLVVLLLTALLQAGLVVRDQILLTHAAREAVRAAALDPDAEAIARAAERSGPLAADRMDMSIAGRDGPGSQVTVKLSYRTPTNMVLVGPLIGDVTLRASASMRVER